ncbi:TniQ family protein [uncultured Propionivibrio sp.]|uniref:TniQ family protein n=1 Tax=uncultured Propionivibrio sp. TaxID=426737 RepID=UPI0029BFEB87|nr:TniQ family protein [uncultured Propionivibrio sp.]
MDSELLRDFQLSVNVPPRSRLFSLAPGGAGTPDQEGLLSLLIRTCHAHAVNPRLVIRDIFSEAEPSIRRIPTAAFYQHLAGTMNGLGKYAELFVSAMEKLTGRTNLRVLTMLPWQSLFPHNGQGMLARHRRWCPVCLHQQRLNSEVAAWPLIWSLDTYSFCRRHLVPLEHCCPSCGKAQPFVPSYPDLGICSHCHRPLGCRHEPQEVSEFQHWIADALSGIVEQQSETGFSPSLEVFHKFLVGQVEAHTEGNRAAFCRALGLNEFAISGWLNKGERPSITQFLTICYGTKTMPWEVFYNPHSISTVGQLLLPKEKLRNRNPCKRPIPVRHAELRQELLEHLTKGTELSVSAIAGDLRVTRSFLRYWFPDTCKSLSLRSRAAAQDRTRLRHCSQTLRVKAAVRRLRESGEWPSYRKVGNLLKQQNLSLSDQRLREVYKTEIDR